jgi:hypothetical protein
MKSSPVGFSREVGHGCARNTTATGTNPGSSEYSSTKFARMKFFVFCFYVKNNMVQEQTDSCNRTNLSEHGAPFQAAAAALLLFAPNTFCQSDLGASSDRLARSSVKSFTVTVWSSSIFMS